MTAWVAMRDVSSELASYSRGQPLPPDVALERARLILDRLAHFHAWWERPDRQEKLAECDWLLAWEDKVWANATTWARVLGREPVGGRGTGSLMTEARRAGIDAFLKAMAPEDRRLWERLMCDRRPLLAALHDVPHTLIHGDPDDRNIGLRWVDGDHAAELVLIDWETTGSGPAAFDAAYVVFNLPFVCDASKPCPEACYSDELPEHYFDRYVAAGGTRLGRDVWHRSFGVAGLVPALWAAPNLAANLLPALEGGPPMGRLIGVSEDNVLEGLQVLWEKVGRMTTQATLAAKKWLV
jgi:hypothetical protein